MSSTYSKKAPKVKKEKKEVKVKSITLPQSKNNDPEIVKPISLTFKEQKEIEEKRILDLKKEVFIQAYNKLIQKHKFAVTVDMESPIGKPQLTVVRVG